MTERLFRHFFGGNMKFQDYSYQSVDFHVLRQTLEQLKKEIESADSSEKLLSHWRCFDQVVQDFDSNVTLCSIRHSIDTKNLYYSKENSYYDENLPVIEEIFQQINASIVESPYMADLKKCIPPTYFLTREMAKKSYSKKIIEELQEENALCSKYQTLIASAEIQFEGNLYTLASLEVLTYDKDRELRKKATKAYWKWFEDNEQEILKIFDDLVKVRHRMALKMGYENFVTMGYYRMNRFDYGEDDIQQYRNHILKYVVPAVQQLYQAQKERLGLKTLFAWDEKVEFPNGNPKPKISSIESIEQARKMYISLSKETGDFFSHLVDHDLIDYESKPGKAAGGFCTYIPKYRSPFIFANFNGSCSDVETLTHEAGHAFQVWCSRDIFPMECVWPTYESCEIHSMTMEFLTYPWMKLFFQDDAERYQYQHMAGALKFLPYGVLVDHFQHEVYMHPNASSSERMAFWRELEKKYCPHKDYSEIPFLERGGWWMRQLHIFMDPFYYIDYTLAQVCALQFWVRIQEEDPEVLSDYFHICKIGGKYPFRDIVKQANLKIPFEADCLKKTVALAENWLQNMNHHI